MLVDQRARLLRAAVGVALVPPSEPELSLLHRWLDAWRGVGDVVSGMNRTKQGQLYELSFAIGSTVKFIDPTSTTRDVEIRVDVAGVTKAFPASPTQEVSHWDTNTMRFTARDQMTTLRLSGEPQPRVGGRGYLGLDNVSVRRLCTLFMVVWSDCQVSLRCKPESVTAGAVRDQRSSAVSPRVNRTS